MCRWSASTTRVGKQRRLTHDWGYCRRMLVGYARVSTAEQDPDHQTDALARAGVTQTISMLITPAARRPPGRSWIWCCGYSATGMCWW